MYTNLTSSSSSSSSGGRYVALPPQETITPTTPIGLDNALHAYFDKKPDFCLYVTSFAGPAAQVLALYSKEVEKRTGCAFPLQHRATPLADGQVTLRLVVPAHCGYKQIAGEVVVSEDSLENWALAAGSALKNLIMMHEWAPIAFGMKCEGRAVMC